MMRRVVLLICCIVMASCQTSPARPAGTKDRVAAVRVEWRSGCYGPASEAFFSVTVSARGEVQYEGLKHVRQLGPRGTSITGSRARTILARARAIVADVNGGTPDPADVGGECLRIEVADVRGDGSAQIRTNAPAARALGTLLKQSARIQDWVCPARKDVPERDFICGQPALSYSTVERHACLQRRITDIYADGSAHDYVTNSELPDWYGRIAPEQIAALTQVPAGAPLEEIVVPGTALRIFHVTGAYAVAYSDRLRQVTGFAPRSLPPGKTCDYGKEFPVGHLVLPR